MKPVMQNQRGEFGNCLTACVASVLELPIHEVPNFIEYEQGNGEYLTVFNEFLARYGYQALTIYLSALDKTWIPAGYHLIYGYSQAGVKHAVVGYRGVVVHDPADDDEDLASIESYTVFVATLEKSPRKFSTAYSGELHEA